MGRIQKKIQTIQNTRRHGNWIKMNERQKSRREISNVLRLMRGIINTTTVVIIFMNGSRYLIFGEGSKRSFKSRCLKTEWLLRL